MTDGYVFALIAFGAGLFLLLGWVYLTADNSRANKLLLKSLGFFVVPGFVLGMLIPLRALPGSFAVLIGTFIEECLKAAAAATEQKRADRFWLVSLFGVWEIMLAKPLLGIARAAVFQGLTQLEIAGLTVGALVGVLMHTVTAEIYAFRFGGRLPLALVTCWAVHATFDLSVNWMGVSLTASLVRLLPLFLLTFALWPSGTSLLRTSNA